MIDSETEDFARIEINSPFNEEWLREFIKEPQRILRINSLFEFSVFEKITDDSWHIIGKNLSNKQDFDVTFKTKKIAKGILLNYDGWLKTSTEITINKGEDQTTKLIIIDDYSGSNNKERQQRIAEVDNSIVQWGNDIYRYFSHWKRWSWIPGWKAYMLKFWITMKPSARRISFLLFAITAAEFVIFLFVFLIFWLELPKYISS